MVHLEGWVTWHRMTLPWGTCLERRIDHMSRFASFLCVLSLSSVLGNFINMYCIRVFQMLVRGGGNRKFYFREEFFYWVKRTRGEVILTIRTIFKLKTAFCEYWTSIKIKFNMTCLYKEYELKTKMEQEQWLQLKTLFLLGYNLKIVV